VGSLCTGYGGLELALAYAGVDHRLAFVADPDPAASKVLAHHHPAVTNLGDIRAIDWTKLPQVDLLCAGYPCQGESLVGKRRGTDDERWLWEHVFAAVRDLRPRVVLLENVAGHLSMGFGRVLGDLASVGFDARWMCLRASDIGAAHRRDRVFVYAHPADTASQRYGNGRAQSFTRIPATAVPNGDHGLVPTPGARLGKCVSITPETAERRLTRGKGVNLDDWAALLPTPRASANENRQTKRTPSQQAGSHGLNLAAEVCTLFPTPRATDGTKGGPNQRGSAGDLTLPSAVQLLPTPTVQHSARNATANRAAPKTSTHVGGWTLADVAHADRWGRYTNAIARWEVVTGRPSPEPTEPGRSAAVRLAPAFVEWLMGLPPGYVTDVPGLSRNDMLRLLGNGVVPQHGAAAFAALDRAEKETSC
jgi:DNA (cytosine-5)-methyltransferase 1